MRLFYQVFCLEGHPRIVYEIAEEAELHRQLRHCANELGERIEFYPQPDDSEALEQLRMLKEYIDGIESSIDYGNINESYVLLDYVTNRALGELSMDVGLGQEVLIGNFYNLRAAVGSAYDDLKTAVAIRKTLELD